MGNDMIPNKNYDITEITRLLLKMRDACVHKDCDAYDDLERLAKYYALEDAADLINNPSLLVRHGRWKQHRIPKKYGATVPICSCCGMQDFNGSLRCFAYCPNCGAKMDDEKPR